MSSAWNDFVRECCGLQCDQPAFSDVLVSSGLLQLGVEGQLPPRTSPEAHTWR